MQFSYLLFSTVAALALFCLNQNAHAFQVRSLGALRRSPSKGSCSSAHSSSSSDSRSRCNLSMRWGLKASGTANKPTGDLPDGVALRDTVPFELRGFSLPLVVFTVGILLTATSFAGYFTDEGGSGGAVSSLGFVYGIPVFLIGLSLWYAEIKPVPVESDAAGDRAWDKHASTTFLQIKQDVTRHRYGDDAHLDSTLEALGLKLPQKKFPKLLSLKQEETSGGQLGFTLTFQSLETPYKLWADPQRVRRYSKFFGPNVIATVEKVNPDQRILALKLTTCTEEDYNALIESPIESAPSVETTTAEEQVDAATEGAVSK